MPGVAWTNYGRLFGPPLLSFSHKVPALMTYRLFFKKGEHVIRSKCFYFLEIPFLAFLALHTERNRCGQMGPTPCHSQSQVYYEGQLKCSFP